MDLLKIGKSGNIEKDKFISRFFGIFNEKIAELYFNSPYSKYKNLGRPTIKYGKEKYTFDFTLQNKETNKIYVCEMKCEMQFNNYKRLLLENIDQILSHKKVSFIYFLDISKNKSKHKIEVDKKEIKTDGIILLWGKITNDTNALLKIKEHFGFYEIISLEKLINIMVENNYNEYYQYINEKREWINNFFDEIITIEG